MKIFVSVVSHGHFSTIQALGVLPLLAEHENVEVCILDNVNEPGLRDWSEYSNIHYITQDKRCGFGENNNKVFDFFYGDLKVRNSVFLVLNPDVKICANDLFKLTELFLRDGAKIAAISLFKDFSFQTPDCSIRRFPTLHTFIKSYFFGNVSTGIEKKKLRSGDFLGWAAGSFLMFDPSHFKKIGGFDTKYFMYCEDIDICLRSWLCEGVKLTIYPNIKAVHLANHQNRKLFSKHFAWHVASVLRYLIRYYLNLRVFNKRT